MATYKVIQDIEAEDKLFGPFSFKQMVFGLGGVFFAWLSFFSARKGFPYAMVIFVPPMLLGFFLAFPWSKDQPTEVWVLAKLRFKLKPRKRIWDQSGMEELVTITAPKKEEKVLTNNLSQVEVKSRLEALAKTIDTRGWAVKHAELDQALQLNAVSDRLVSPSTLPQEVPAIDLNTIPDVMEAGTPTYTNLDRMIQESTDTHMQQSLDKLDRLRNGEPLESINRPEIHFTPPAPSALDEAALSAELKSHRRPDVNNSHLRKIEPFNPYAVAPTEPAKPEPKPPEKPVPTTVDPAILNDSNLNLDTLTRNIKKDTTSDGEVVISLR